MLINDSTLGTGIRELKPGVAAPEVKEPDYAQAESRRHINKLTVDAHESCDIIIVQCRKRFFFAYYFPAVQLFATLNFPSYQNIFQTAKLTETISAYLLQTKSFQENFN